VRVLLFTNHYPGSDAPTRGTYNQSTFGALSKYMDIRVVGALPIWQGGRSLVHRFTVQRESRFGLDASFASFVSIPGRPAFHAQGIHLSLRPLMERIRREFPYDIIVATWAYPDATAAAHFANDVECPLITTVLGSDVNELPNRPELRPQIVWGLKRAQRVVAVSGAMGERVIELGVPRERVVVQHNAVDGEKFSLRDRDEARKRLGISPKGPMILYVGNLRPEKGVGVLVEAMSHLGKERPDAELFVVGGGPMQAELEEKRSRLGLGKTVHLVGRALHEDVPFWMNACDVHCLPSYREGCPNVILEALASGRPVVASRVGGIPEILSDATGVMVEAGDAQALAKGLAEALARSWDAEKQRASVEYLSWDAVAQVYRDMITRVVDEWRYG